jgi:hypothetical protein
MSFSDEDLKRLKEELNKEQDWVAFEFEWCDRSVLKALLARLEAAERVALRFSVLFDIGIEVAEIAKLTKIELDQRYYRIMVAKDDVEAWRKSKGA